MGKRKRDSRLASIDLESPLEEKVVSEFRASQNREESCCRCNVLVGDSVICWKPNLDNYPNHEGVVFWGVELKPDTYVPVDRWLGCSS
ncbi:hypothetical protein Bca101_030685 [Brassica carinata]